MISSDVQIVTLSVDVDRRVVQKWAKEFNRLRNEERR